MALSRAARQYLGVRAILPPDLQTATRAPTSADRAYVKGTLWLDTVASTAYMWPGSGDWITLGSGTAGGVVSLTGDSGGAISPVGGNIDLLGETDQLVVAGTAGTLTFALVEDVIAPGSLTATTFLTATTDITATTGDILASAGNITATLGNIVADAGDITATAGAVTAGTTVTATLGAITATDGNLVLGTAGNKIIIEDGANASVGVSGVMSGSPGAVTVATTASSATALIFYSRATTGGTPGHVSITAQDATGFTLTSTGDETSTFNWWIINA
jgi:hypothetical protein